MLVTFITLRLYGFTIILFSQNHLAASLDSLIRSSKFNSIFAKAHEVLPSQKLRTVTFLLKLKKLLRNQSNETGPALHAADLILYNESNYKCYYF